VMVGFWIKAVSYLGTQFDELTKDGVKPSRDDHKIRFPNLAEVGPNEPSLAPLGVALANGKTVNGLDSASLKN